MLAVDRAVMPLRLAEGLVRPDIDQIELHRAHGAVFVDLRGKGDIDHVALGHGGPLRVGGKEDRAPGERTLAQPQPQMLAAADLGQLRDLQPAHAQDRPRAARAAGLELVERLDIFDGQQLRRDLAVDRERRAAGVRLPEAAAKLQHFLAEGLNARAPDGEPGGKLMPAVALEQPGQLLERAEEVESAV